MRAALPLAVALVLILAGCSAERVRIEETDLTVSPGRVEFPDTTAGTESTAEVTLHNAGRTSRELSLDAGAPFAFDETFVQLGAGASTSVTVRFRPLTAGRREVTANILEGPAPLAIRLSGEGIAPAPADACHEVVCDTERCTQEPVKDGTSCALSNACSTFRCEAGACVETRAPDGTECAAAGECQDAGYCRAGVCDQPPPNLVERWRYEPEGGWEPYSQVVVSSDLTRLAWLEQRYPSSGPPEYATAQRLVSATADGASFRKLPLAGGHTFRLAFSADVLILIGADMLEARDIHAPETVLWTASHRSLVVPEASSEPGVYAWLTTATSDGAVVLIACAGDLLGSGGDSCRLTTFASLDARTGALRWQFMPGVRGSTIDQLFGDDTGGVLISITDGNAHESASLGPEGEERWRLPRSYLLPIAAGRKAILGWSTGAASLIDTVSGTTMAEFDLRWGWPMLANDHAFWVGVRANSHGLEPVSPPDDWSNDRVGLAAYDLTDGSVRWSALPDQYERIDARVLLDDGKVLALRCASTTNSPSWHPGDCRAIWYSDQGMAVGQCPFPGGRIRSVLSDGLVIEQAHSLLAYGNIGRVARRGWVNGGAEGCSPGSCGTPRP